MMIKKFATCTKLLLTIILLQTPLTVGLASFKKIGGRIIGGEPARAGEFPWAAAITVNTATGRHFCTGALVHHQWVLTAGQCVDGATLFSIVVGTTKRDGSENTAHRVATDTYFLHPDFNPLTLDHDIALIRFREQLPYSDWIGKAYLPYYEVHDGSDGSIFGWGQLDDSEAGLSNELHWVSLTALSQEGCKTYYGNQITENMFCAGGNYNEGTCLGDSGSAMTTWISRGYNIILGLAIFNSGNGCESAEPSGFINVFRYNDWLRNITDAII